MKERLGMVIYWFAILSALFMGVLASNTEDRFFVTVPIILIGYTFKYMLTGNKSLLPWKA
jgi:hypothetical protein